MYKIASEQCLICPVFTAGIVCLKYFQDKALHMKRSAFLSALECIIRIFSTLLLTSQCLFEVSLENLHPILKRKTKLKRSLLK